MKKTSIILKGRNFTVFVIYLNNNCTDSFLYDLKKKINESPVFFKNAPVVINASKLSYKTNWKKIKNDVISSGLFIVGVSECHDSYLKKIILESGTPILSEGIFKNKNNIKEKNFKKSFYKNSILNKNTKIIDFQVRSGQKIYALNADLIVTNNVNSGSELISDGNIHVYGILRGRALAGANGDVTKRIYCTQLYAELVSIAGEYWMIEQIPLKYIGFITEIRLKKGLISIQRFF